MRLSDLKSLGPKSQQMLEAAGINTVDELYQLGAVAAYLKVKQQCPRASLNLLWALESAMTGIPWQEVARLHRARLLTQVAALQRS